MTGEEFEQEVLFYREAILNAMIHADPGDPWDRQFPDLFARFASFAQDDRTRFQQLCFRLLDEEQFNVRAGTLNLISLLKIRDTKISYILIYIAMKYKEATMNALYALWRVGTRAVLPQILRFAEKGYMPALYMSRRMLQTSEEIERGIAIARKYIAAEDYEMREGVLFLLQKYSSMDQEAERVLEAVQKYEDELFIAALKDAPPEKVLEPLKALRASIGKGYVQYEELTATIDVLEYKQREGTEQKEEK